LALIGNSTTNPAMDAKSIMLKRYKSSLLNAVLYVAVLVLQRKFSGFKEVILRLDFDLQFLLSSFTLSGVSVDTVHYAGSNNPHIEQKYIK
jgi:hypothetical protein